MQLVVSLRTMVPKLNDDHFVPACWFSEFGKNNEGPLTGVKNATATTKAKGGGEISNLFVCTFDDLKDSIQVWNNQNISNFLETNGFQLLHHRFDGVDHDVLQLPRFLSHQLDVFVHSVVRFTPVIPAKPEHKASAIHAVILQSPQCTAFWGNFEGFFVTRK